MRLAQNKLTTALAEVLAVSLELAKNSWKLAISDGQRERPSHCSVDHPEPMARLEQAIACIEAARQRWGLSADCRVVVVFEAGQDGFWIARALQARGYEALPVDPASIPVERHARRRKTDRLDAQKLVSSLLGWLRGEKDRMHVVRIPRVEDEAERQRVRERGQLQKEIQQHTDRIVKLLRTVGCWTEFDASRDDWLQPGALRCADGQPLPAPLLTRLQREHERLCLAQEQLRALERALRQALPAATQARIEQLQQLKGVGPTGATRLMLELFWRTFQNRRQVGACVGLTPQPYDSGESRVDQGISKQGNRKLRALLIELAWLWLRYQPDSALSRWFAQRTQGSGKRGRRIMIVAVARRLVIDLWRYLEQGTLPKGATLKG